MPKKQRKYITEIQERSGVTFTRVELSAGNHLKLYLPSGRFVITGGTPSDRRALLNCVALVRRLATI